MSRISKQVEIDSLKASLDSYLQRNRQVEAELVSINLRLKQIASENESLRMDKKWLQSIISPLAQAIHTRS